MGHWPSRFFVLAVLAGCSAPVSPQPVMNPRLPPTYAARGMPDLEVTSRSLDIAVDHGLMGRRDPVAVLDFLVLSGPDGTQYYTRWGHLELDGGRVLVGPRGYPLSPRIVFPPEPLTIHIREDGLVLVGEPGKAPVQELGVIQVARFTNPEGLAYAGDHLYVATAASGAPKIGQPALDGHGVLKQGMLDRDELAQRSP